MNSACDDLHIRRARSAWDYELLAQMDSIMFRPSDAFDREEFQRYRCWVIEINGEPVGSIALAPHIDLNTHCDEVSQSQSLYIASTGIMPGRQRQGLGAIAKAFELGYARAHGFRKVVTMCRFHNTSILRLNARFGFQPRGSVPGIYDDPYDDAVIMELCFS